MTMTPEQWCGSADALLGPSLDRGTAEDEVPVVVLAGAYNTGKTSLLRRLLADDGQAVPDWARVSAREETATVNEVQLLGCRLVDTPGLEGLSQWHGSATREALLTADAVLLMTTSDLFAADDERAVENPALDGFAVASGRIFRTGGLPYPDGALAIVVNRFDEATLDPTEFPDDYQAARTKKLQELQSLLQREAPQAVAGSYRDAISCDPFGRTRNRSADRSSYDAYRKWDGVEELVAWLQRIPERLADLRQWREVRTRAEALTGLVVDQDQAARQALTDEATARAKLAGSHLVHSRCTREHDATAVRLQSALDQALFSAPVPTDPAFKAELQKNLRRELEQWAQQTLQDLQSLAEQAAINLPEVAPRDSGEAATSLVGRSTGPSSFEQASQTAGRGIKLVKTTLNALAAVSHEGQPTVKDPGGWAATAWVKPDVAAKLEVLLGIGTDILGMVVEEAATRTSEQQALRQRLLREGKGVSHQMFFSQATPDGWEGLFGRLLSDVDASRSLWTADVQDASARVAHAEKLSREARDLLAAVPAPTE